MKVVATGLILAQLIVFGLGSRADAAGPSLSQVRVEVLSTQDLGVPYVFVRAALSGSVRRTGGTSGTFRVPLWFVVPRNERNCNGVGVVEGIHTAGLPTFLAFVSDAEDGNQGVDWPTLAGGASLFGTAHGGYSWAGMVWNKAMLESLRGTTFQGIPVDDSYDIQR